VTANYLLGPASHIGFNGISDMPRPNIRRLLLEQVAFPLPLLGRNFELRYLKAQRAKLATYHETKRALASARVD
jgi:hypothetical protein